MKGLRKEAGENSYAREAVPQRCVESQWWEDGGPDPLDPARGDNKRNNKLRQEGGVREGSLEKDKASSKSKKTLTGSQNWTN